MPRPSTRQWAYAALGVALLLGNGYAFWPFIAAERALHQFCDQLPAGLAVAELQALAQRQGYSLSLAADGSAQIDDPLAQGRRSCTLRIDALGRLAPPH